ncbi:hypothetical protein [Gemmatimonas phototrophica]|uniref:hypothetical protein n=1 Tax=Gemmatimonas phototrophica TaxID=1379270 RepID=UPI00131499BE|nr:hypothetical protein [Gemmatimonas phototrophica]
MPQRMLRCPLGWAWRLGAALCFPLAAAQGQSVSGVGDDAIPIPRGGFRIQVGGLWNDYREVYSPGAGKQALLRGLATENLGVNLMPQLSDAQAGIRALTGNSSFALSLGPLESAGEVRQSIAPFALDYGVSRRLSLRAVVPYVESRDVSQLILNRNGTAANVGRNPALGTAGQQARAANAALLGQIDAARTALTAEISRCANVSATGCDAIRANPAGAQTLVTRASQTRSSLATVYGDGDAAGAPVVPISGSSLHAAVVSTVGALRTDFGAYGITSIAAAAQPQPAVTIFGPGSIGSITSDTFNVGYARLGDTRRAGIGDIDLTATYLLFDSFNADQVKRVLSPARGLRSNLTVGWRFGTAGADRAEDAFDVPIGEGANALLVRSTTDVLFNRWAWMSATVRAVKPFGDRIAVVVPFRDETSLLSSPVDIVSAARTLGTRLEFEVAPRMAIGQFFGLSASYLVRHWGADVFDTERAESSASLTEPFTTPSRTFSAAAVGVTFSTLNSYVRGRSRFPAEVVYTHTTPLGASGGFVPVVSSDRLELRIYTGFPRR